MSTATRGTVLAGRYRLETRIHSNADGALWRAVDSTLDRRVSIRVMRPGHPFAPDVADAARRAALIDDPRLIRVLDVGSDGDTGFVVSEDIDGDTLAVLVERSPLAAPVVRRIIGEVALGLEASAARGLHHLCLTPRSVIVTRDGAVKVVGTAVEAAAAGLEPAHAATASRDDAIALVGLLYSGLTGRWPLGNAGFPPAPRGEGGGPVPPADLVRGIPNDLDTLCAVTLGGDDGPRSPAELAEELAPWPSAEEAPLRAAPRRPTPDTPPGPAGSVGADSPLKIRSRPTSKRGSAAKPARGVSPLAADDEPIEAAAPPASANPDSSPRRSATMFPTPSVALTGSLPIPKEPIGEGPRRMDSLFSVSSVDSGTPAATTEKLQSTTETKPGSGSGSGTAPASARKAPTDRASNASAEEPMLPWGPAWSNDAVSGPGSDATGPFPILIPAETPPREQSRLVIFSIAVVLVLGLVVAAFSLRDLGSSRSVEPAAISTPAPTTAASTPTQVATTAPVVPVPTTAEPTATKAVPVEIASIRAIDPQGDGDEDTAASPLAVDGNDSTSWHSQTYRSASFGGLKKGVGLSLKLKRSATLTSATIDASGTGGVVEVRTANSPDVTSSTVVGKGIIKNGRVTLTTKNAKPAKYVILWFTSLPSVSGSYKIEVSEVRLK